MEKIRKFWACVLAVSILGASLAMLLPQPVEGQTSSGLVAYWDFDEGSGTVLHDRSGNGNDGAVSGATWASGISGGGLSLDGIDDYVSVPDSSELRTFSQMTLSCWINVNEITYTNGHGEMIVGKGKHTPSNIYALWVADDIVAGKVCFSYTMIYSDTSSKTVSSGYAYNKNTWYHVMGTYDGSSMKLYVDGAVVNQTGNSLGVPYNTDTMYMGKHNWGTSSTSYRIRGTIDEIKIYDRALLPSEVTTGYSATAPTVPLNIQVTAGDGYCLLNWELPASDGGSAITGYRVYRGSSPGSEVLLLSVGNVLRYNDTTAINGQTYYYYVTAINSAGESASSGEAIALPVAPPESQGPWLWVLLIIIVAVVCLGLAALLRKKRPKEPEPKQVIFNIISPDEMPMDRNAGKGQE